MAISDKAKDFWERISPRERKLVALLAVAVPVTLAIWLGLAIHDGLNDMESRNDKIRRALDVVADLHARGISGEVKDDVVAQMGSEPLSLETYLDKAAQKAGITFKGAITPSGTVTRNGFVTHTVKVDFGDATIEQVKNFFQEVETGSKYVAVTHIDARRNYKGKDKLDLSVDVSTYSREAQKTDAGSATGSGSDKKGAEMAFHLGPRTLKAVRIAGFILFGLVTFVFALQMTLPYDRAKDRAIERLADKGWDMSVGEVERGWIPGRVYLHSVRLTSRSSKPDDVPMVFFIKDLKVDVGLLTMLGGNFAVDIDAKVANGRLTGRFEAPLSFGAGTYVVKADAKDLASDALPMQTFALQPTKGDLTLSADVSLTIEPLKSGKTGVNWQKLEGSVEVGCPSNCVYGDGKTKLKMKLNNRNKGQAEFGKDGIEFGIIKIDSMLAQLEAKNGKLTLDKLDVKSADGELKGEYTMDLQQEVSESGVAGCISYKGSEELLKRDQRSFDAISLIGGALGPDKLFHIRLSEKWRDIKKQGIVCGGPGGSMDDPGGSTPGTPGVRRPNLAVQPDMPPPPPATTTPPPPPPMPTPAPPPPTGSAATAQPVDPEHPPGSAPPGAYVPPPGAGSAGSAVPVPEGSAAPPPGP